MKSVSETLFLKYEYLAVKYANKVFNLAKIGLEKNDITQEFRIKLYQVILSYGVRYSNWKKGLSTEPTPIEVYIKSSLSNFVKDYIKEIESKKTNTFVSSSASRDYANCSPDFNNVEAGALSTDSKQLEIGGFDILQGLDENERKMFILFLRGYKKENLVKIFKRTGMNVSAVINRQKQFLRKNKSLFYPENNVEYFVTEFQEEA